MLSGVGDGGERWGFTSGGRRWGFVAILGWGWEVSSARCWVGGISSTRWGAFDRATQGVGFLMLGMCCRWDDDTGDSGGTIVGGRCSRQGRGMGITKKIKNG